jgi:cytoskeletal protein CcmA (bactofilin family)
MFGRDESGAASGGEPGRIPPKAAGTVIGPGARIVGDLSAEEDVTIAGRFEGKIRVGQDVRVIAGGEVEGEIEARSVVVSGSLRGEVVASHRAELTSTAVVEGSVRAPKIIIAEGAQLEGRVAMSASSVEQKSSKE